MEACYLPSRSTLPPTRIFPTNRNRRNTLTFKRFVVNATKDEEEGSVDEKKIVVKMSFRKMKLPPERKDSDNQEFSPLPDRKDSEKKLSTEFLLEDFDEALELLQLCLMKVQSRPSVVALLMVFLVATMSFPATSVVMVNVLKVVKALLTGGHVNIDIDF